MHESCPEGITPEEFRRWPALLSRAQLARCLGRYWKLESLYVEAKDNSRVPVGRIGVVRLMRYRKFRKADVARLLGPEYT